MGKNRDGLENNNDWETPDWMYNQVNDIFHFDHDPCPKNFKVDGLDKKYPWGSRNWINPPYDRVNKPKFIKRAFEEYSLGMTCVLLIPSAMDTVDFHDIIYPDAVFGLYEQYINDWEYRTNMNFNKKIILFFKGRISFKGVNTKGEYTENNKGKYGSMLVIFKP